MGEETDSMKKKKKKIVKQEIEGEHYGTDDFFFQRIGKPIPITNTNSNSDDKVYQLDEEGLPSRPLALSQHPHRLIFVAHSSGFCVARTKDVMDAAQGSNGPCSIQEVSLVDVPILHQGRVRILSLSADFSTLAACVSAHIHFFSVASLLNKDPKPSFSCSLSQPSTIKDMQWRKSSDTSFLLLSNLAKLYHATLGGPLNLVFDSVDAFDWSPKGKYIAVARENNLSIFSSKFEEKLGISLPFKSWVGDSPDNCIVKVDSIRWVRQDSIIVGCFQQTADGVEENYLLQVVRSKNGKIVNADSELVVLSFYDLYSVIVDDIVPSGTGPYLLLAYLKQCQLAITAHRKNIDQHIVYLGWPVNDDMNEVSAVEIERDAWLPRIELQGNGDDNLVLGLCVDEVSLYGKVKVEVGVEEQKELSPYCVLMCVTLEGKLLMFYVASGAAKDTPPVVGLIHDEEEDTVEEVLAGCEQHSVRAANTPSDIDGRHFKFKDAAAAESTSVDFSIRPIQGAGPKFLSGDRKIGSLPSIHSPQLLLPEAFASRDNYKASSMSSSEPNLCRQFGNIKEMPKELDTLLQGIEEAGGFRDACTVSQRISVKELEEGMGTLFQRCRMWKSTIDERLQDIENLLDETVQVLARKIYLDGIIKQAKDRRYWELWDQQRLSSEFEMKRRCILQLNQAMTNQLIELERHFNKLEFQKFGEHGEAYMGRRTIQNRPEPARSIEPLLSLHNAMNSQLAAAELLSDRLSKQMASLRIESPVNKNNVKKELFEMIGFPYDTSFSSPDATKFTGTTSPKNLLLSSGLATTKDHSRRCQVSATKSSASETARRRRDSLDQSWASFEPIKTTVKRVLLQDQNRSLNKSSLLLGRPHLGSLAMEKSAVIHPEGQENPSTLLYPSKYEGVEHASCNQGFNEKLSHFESAKDPLLPLQGTVLRSPFFQSNNASVSTSYGSYLTNQNLTEETPEITADKSSIFVQKSVQQSEIRLQQKSSSVQQSGLGSPFLQSSNTSFSTFHGSQARGQSISEETRKVTVDKSSISIQKSVQQSGATPQQKSTIPTISPLQMPFEPNKSNEVQITDTRSAFTNSKNESVKPGLVHAKGSVFGSASRNSSLSSLSASPGAFNQPVKVPQFDIANAKSQPDDKLSSSPPFLTSLLVSPSATNSSLPGIPSPLSAASSAVPTLSAGLPLGKSLTASAPVADSSQTATSASFTLVPPPLSPSNSLTIGTAVIPSPSNAPALFTDPSKLEPQPAAVSTLSSTSSTASHLLSDYHKTDLQPPVAQSSPSVHPALPLTTESSKTKLQSATLKSVSITPSPLTLELAKTEVQTSKDDLTSTTYKDAATAASVSQSPPLAFGSKLEPVSSSSPMVVPTELTSGIHPSLDSMDTPTYNVALAPHPQVASVAQVLSEASLSAPLSASGKNENLDVAIADEDEMEEEAPETTQTRELSLGGLRGFGAGSSSSPAAPRANPFGAPFGNIGSNQGSSSFNMSVPSGELFRPASFSFSSAMPSQPSAPTNIGGFSSGFSGNVAQAPAQSAFGQPAHVGPGQQALGSVLGAFGQSRQLGGGLPGSGFASPIGFGGGIASTGSASGFSSSASGGGFAGVPTAGGFAGLPQAGRGFADAAAGGSGFGAAASAGGFAAAASSGGGGFAGASSAAGVGFGAFNSQQGTGGFSGFGGISGGGQQVGFGAFGGNTTGTGKPPELFTQMRK